MPPTSIPDSSALDHMRPALIREYPRRILFGVACDRDVGPSTAVSVARPSSRPLSGPGKGSASLPWRTPKIGNPLARLSAKAPVGQHNWQCLARRAPCVTRDFGTRIRFLGNDFRRGSSRQHRLEIAEIRGVSIVRVEFTANADGSSQMVRRQALLARQNLVRVVHHRTEIAANQAYCPPHQHQDEEPTCPRPITTGPSQRR